QAPLDHRSRAFLQEGGWGDGGVDLDVGRTVGEREPQVRVRAVLAARFDEPSKTDGLTERGLALRQQLGGREVVDERLADLTEGEVANHRGDDRDPHQHSPWEPALRRSR